MAEPHDICLDLERVSSRAWPEGQVLRKTHVTPSKTSSYWTEPLSRAEGSARPSTITWPAAHPSAAWMWQPCTLTDSLHLCRV